MVCIVVYLRPRRSRLLDTRWLQFAREKKSSAVISARSMCQAHFPRPKLSSAHSASNCVEERISSPSADAAPAIRLLIPAESPAEREEVSPAQPTTSYMSDVCSTSKVEPQNICSQPIQDCCSAEKGYGIIQSQHPNQGLSTAKQSSCATIDLHRASELGNAEEVENILKSEFDSPTPFDIAPIFTATPPCTRRRGMERNCQNTPGRSRVDYRPHLIWVLQKISSRSRVY